MKKVQLHPAGYFERITGAEWEILDLLVGGLTNTQIAKAINIGSETVKSSLKVIYRKLRVSNRTQAAVLAVRWGGA